MAELDSNASRLIIYTVGHSNHSLEQFLRVLSMNMIKVLVDVRSAPYSRFTPHFNIQPLKLSIKNTGMEYVYLGKELGGRPSEKTYYDEQGNVSYNLLSESPLFLEGIERLMIGITKYRVAIMCAEEDPGKCHRNFLIAKALKAKSVEVRHIRGDGRIEIDKVSADNKEKKMFPIQDTLPGFG
jgi:uncharacterized protein (DUF488 family)